MSDLWMASYIVLWVIVAGLAVIVMGLLRQLGLIQLRLGPEPGVLITTEGLERGTPAPDFETTDLQTGRPVRLSAFRGRRVALVFVTPTCVACRQLVSHLNDVARDHQLEVEVLTLCHGSDATCGEFGRAYRLQTPLLLDPTNSIAKSYDVQVTPFGFLIDEEGIVRIRGVVNSWPQLDALLQEEGTLKPTPWEPVAVSGSAATAQAGMEPAVQGDGRARPMRHSGAGEE